MSRWLAGAIAAASILTGAIGVALLIVGPDSTTAVPQTATEASPDTAVGTPVAPQPAVPLPPLAGPEPSDRWEDTLVKQLVAAGWHADAAKSVVAFHRDWLADLRNHDEPNYRVTLSRLEMIKDADTVEVGNALIHRPEIAGLLAMVDQPRELARVLTGRDGELLTTLFFANLDRDDARLLAAALTGDRGKDGRRVADMIRKGIIGAEAVFALGHENPGVKLQSHEEEYLLWARQVIDEALGGSEDELADVFLFFLAEGENVRNRMKNTQFCRDFATKWALLVQCTRMLRTAEEVRIKREGRVVDPAELPGLADLAAMPGVWEFVNHPHAARLFERRGPLAVDVLHLWAAEPARRDRAADLLLAGDNWVAFLFAFQLADVKTQRWKSLEPFLDNKEISAALLSRVARETNRQPTDAARLKRLKQLSEVLEKGGKDALTKSLDPEASDGLLEYVPGYSVYRVYDKYNAGDEIDNMDLLFAGLDLATLVPGVGLVTTVGKSAGKEAVKGSTKEAAKKIAVEAGKSAGKRSLRDAGEVVANKAGFWLAVRAGYQQVQAAMKRAFNCVVHDAPKHLTVRLGELDITRAVRFVYERCRLGRETFKRLTNLEARLFMRPDARVFLQFRYTVTGQGARAWVYDPLKRVVDEWTEDNIGNPKEMLVVLSPTARDRWKQAAGMLFLMSAANLLPNP